MEKFGSSESEHIEESEHFLDIKDALNRAGFHHIESPRRGTKAYDRLIEAARKYMEQVKLGEISSSRISREDSENYFSEIRRKKSSSSSDGIRREYHDQLAMMILGSKRKGMEKEYADKLSNFAAYLMGDEEYLDSW